MKIIKYLISVIFAGSLIFGLGAIGNVASAKGVEPADPIVPFDLTKLENGKKKSLLKAKPAKKASSHYSKKPVPAPVQLPGD